MKLKSEQARVLRRNLLGGMLARMALSLLAVSLVFALLQTVLKAPVSDFVASQTSAGWRLLNSADQYEMLLQSMGLLPTSGQSSSTSDGLDGASGGADGKMEVGEGSREVDDQYAMFASEEFSKIYAYRDEGATSASSDESNAQGPLQLEIPESMPYYLTPVLDKEGAAIVAHAEEMGFTQDELNGVLSDLFPVSQELAYQSWLELPVRDQSLMLGLDVTNPDWDVQHQGQQYVIRDLSLYNRVAALEVPALIVLLMLLWAIVIARTLNRSIRCFDDLSQAVGGLLADKDAPVELPDSLSIARNELAVIQANAQADERAAIAAEQRKNELVAYLAHDIRTPLTSVLGYLELLSENDGLPPETERRYASVALDKARRLEALVGEFFEITRYNLQSIPIERQNVDVELFCKQVADAFFPEAAERGVTIVVNAPDTGRFFVDSGKLARALGNVMRNAVAYAEEGTQIEVAARTVMDAAMLEGESGFVEIRVTNQGREISDAHLQSIFEKFFRADESRATSGGGAGLGLAVAKEIMEAHGGAIGAESTNGRTTFVMTLPRLPRELG